MGSLIQMWTSSGDLLLLNLMVQMTILTLVALVIAAPLKFRPVLRYAVLYPSLLSLLVLLPFSIGAHYSKISLLESGASSVAGLSKLEKPALEFDTAFWFLPNLEELVFSLDENSTESLNQSAVNKEAAGPDFRLTYSIPLATLLLGLWLLGVVIESIRLMRSQKSLQRIVTASTPLLLTDEDRLSRLIKYSQPSFNLNSVRFLSSKAIHSPVLVGAQQPIILLPENLFRALSDEQITSVLIHELAHLKRGDVLANYVQRVICSVFWFHPVVHLIDRQINRSREEICDNYVLAERDSVNYSEVLLHLSTCSRGKKTRANAKHSNRFEVPLALGIFDDGWTLEERIKGLISDKRETAMKAKKSTSKLIQLVTVSFSLFLAACQFSGTAQDQELLVLSETKMPEGVTVSGLESGTESTDGTVENNEPVLIPVQSPQSGDRKPPQARTSGTLSDDVMAMVEQIQSLLNPEDEGVEPDPAAAKPLLDELTVERYDSLNDFEKQTSLNFLTNYYLTLEDYQSAALVFERLLTIENVRADARLRAIKALGQLYASFEDWDKSNEYYHQWRELAAFEDGVVFKGLSYNYYQIEQWAPAISHWESYMALQKSEDKELKREDYAYLNGMYFTADELEKAVANTKEMILLFDDESDWRNLGTIYSMLDAKNQSDLSDGELLGQLRDSVQTPSIGQTSLTPLDGDYLPLVAVAPLYPTQAANNAIEGWTLVEFTVLEDGRVDEETVEVVDAQPPTVFDITSMRAAKEFEFQPRVVNGKAVAVPGVQYVFRFQLEEEV